MNKGVTQDAQQEGQVLDAVVVSSRQLATELQAQRSMALASPRNEKNVLGGALAELGLVPEFAKTAYYVIPYKDENGNPQPVEGPSVKASRSLARRWRNCATASRVVDDQEEAAVSRLISP